MNTTDPSALNQPLIGLIELPALAETLTRCGVRVATGPDFRSAASAIRDELAASGAFPMVVADIPAPGLRAWIERVQQSAQQQGTPIAASVLRGAGTPVITSPNVTELIGPFTVNQLLESLGLPVIDTPEGNTVYPEGMTIPGIPAAGGLAIPDFGDIFESEEFESLDEPILTAIPAETAPDDDWETEKQVVSVLKSAIAEPVAPILDDWDSIAPPSLAPAAPVEDDWDTPAPAPAFAPLPVSPGAAAPAATTAAPVAPAVPVEDDWDTPAPAAPQPLSRREARALEPAPAPTPAPVRDEPEEDWDTPAPAPSYHTVRQAPAQSAPVQYEAPTQYEAPVLQPPVQYAPAPVQPAPVQYQVPAVEAAPVQPQAPVRYEAPADPDWATPSTAVAVPQQAVSDAWSAVRRPARDGFDVDASPIFDQFEASKLSGTGRSAAGLGSFIVNFSGKGGVGKSTTSLQLAHVAAAAGLRVILIDGNSGQGDLRTYLRLNRTALPTIYDAAIKDIRSAVLTPDVINSHREDNLGQVNFAFIGAPPDDINDPAVVTNELYADVIRYARRNADLVILDTQIIETSDRTGVVSQILLPALVHDAWGLGITDMSNTGVNNLNNRLRIFLENGVPLDRLMVMVNKVHPEQATVATTMPKYFGGIGYYLGTIATDLDVQQDMNAGRINISNQDLRTLMSKALLRITGNEAFRADAEYQPEEAGQKGFFAKVFGRK